MSLLAVGSMALDSVETPFGSCEEVLGGSATFFSYAASFFCRPVQVVAVIGEDFPTPHLDLLKDRGIDLSGVARSPGRTFRWKGRYGHQLGEAHTLDTQLNVFEHFDPVLPPSFRKASFVFLGNIHPELQLRVLSQVESPKLVAADTMNFWIQGELPALKRVLKRIDLLFVNDAEARQLSGEHNIVKAAKAIGAQGPSRLMIKRGEYGALLFDDDRTFSCPALPLTDVYDPTGAGDTFAGAAMGHLAQVGAFGHQHLRQAAVLGGVMASFAVERFSLERLKTVERPEIEARYRQIQKLTQFIDL